MAHVEKLPADEREKKTRAEKNSLQFLSRRSLGSFSLLLFLSARGFFPMAFLCSVRQQTMDGVSLRFFFFLFNNHL